MSKYKLLFFDLDGTIVNSMYDIGDALNHTYKTFGKKEIPYDKIPAMVGGGIRKLLVDAFGESADIDTIHTVFYDYYATHFVDKTRPYPTVEVALKQLNFIKKAIYSNKPHHFTTAIIDSLSLKKHFDFVQGSRPDLYQSKPNPSGILYALAKMNIQPQETLFIGDSTHDILAGKAVGTDTCAVTYGYRSKKVLLAEKPDFIIDDLLELVDTLSMLDNS